MTHVRASFTAVSITTRVLAIVAVITTLGASSAAQSPTLGAPVDLQAVVEGFQVTLSWEPPVGDLPMSGYILEAGSAPGLANLGRMDMSVDTHGLSVPAPAGTYFIRIRGKNGTAVGPASNEIVVAVPAGCDALTAPTGLRANVTGAFVSLVWSSVGGATSYILEAGAAPGLSNLATVDTQSAIPALDTTAPDGLYHVRVRARNACGVGPPSNDAVITVDSCATPPAPSELTVSVNGTIVALQWSGLALPTIAYVLEVGTTPGGVELGQHEVGSATSLTATTPLGTYYLRVRARSACGLGRPSNEVIARVGPTEPPPPPSAPWLKEVNAWRAHAGLPPVTENPIWSEGDVLHGRYSVKEDILEHDELTTSPWFTTAGRDAAKASNGAGNGAANAPDSFAIEAWVQAPFHAVGMFDPQLRRVGYGSYREADEVGLQMSGWLDVLRGLGAAPPTTTYPIFFPANGTVIPIPNAEICPRGFACFWGETPSPLTHCPGYAGRAGLPLIVQFAPGTTPVVTASTLTLGDAPLEHCVMTGATYANPNATGQATGRSILAFRRAVVIVPKQPLPANSTYVASLTVGGHTHTWSFSIGPAPVFDGPAPAWAIQAVPPSLTAPKRDQ